MYIITDMYDDSDLSFPQVQRRVVHELAEFYGCETQSYDQEPNKNVVATAYKWVPNIIVKIFYWEGRR